MGKNVTVYIRNDIADKLKGIEVGPLINELLSKHFSSKQEVVNAVANLKHDAPLKATGISGAQYDSYEKKDTEKICCSKNNRCQHWDWDSDSVEWINNLSGRRVAA